LALTRIANPENEADLVSIALGATASHIERMVRTYRRVLAVDELSAEMGAVNARHARRFVRWHWDDDGSFVFSGRLSPEDGAVVVAALEAAGRSVPDDDTPRPECSAQHHGPRCSAEHLPPVARTHADALVALAHANTAAEVADRRAGWRATRHSS